MIVNSKLAFGLSLGRFNRLRGLVPNPLSSSSGQRPSLNRQFIKRKC